jgi:hypothetical protein
MEEVRLGPSTFSSTMGSSVLAVKAVSMHFYETLVFGGSTIHFVARIDCKMGLEAGELGNFDSFLSTELAGPCTECFDTAQRVI